MVVLDYYKELINIFRSYSEKLIDGYNIEKVSEKEIETWESEIGAKLPEDYKTFLLNNETELNLCFNYRILSFELEKRDWDSMCEHLNNGIFEDGRKEHHIKENFGNWDGDKIQKNWWNKKWIPFSAVSFGKIYMSCIDLDTKKNGPKGQIISMEIQDGQGPFINGMFSNFEDCLKKNLEYIKAGKFYLEDYGDCIQLPAIDSYM
jgi:cell wall assembly regulator SMI1